MGKFGDDEDRFWGLGEDAIRQYYWAKEYANSLMIPMNFSSRVLNFSKYLVMENAKRSVVSLYVDCVIMVSFWGGSK